MFLAMPFAGLRSRLDRSPSYDFAMRWPIAIYSAFILSRDVVAFCQQLPQDPAVFGRFDAGVAMAALARTSQWMFVVLLAIQQLFRFRPIAKSENIMARVVALSAVCVPPLFMLIQRAPPSLVANALAVAVSLAANVMSVVTVSFLGRSLSVMPEARRLVQSGPYGVVRHPLYLCEMLGTVAVALQYRSPAAGGLVLIAIMLQVARARWEEAVLAGAFPDFAAYRSRTSFLIPRHPLRFLASFAADFAARRRLAIVVASLLVVLALAAIVLPRLIA